MQRGGCRWSTIWACRWATPPKRDADLEPTNKRASDTDYARIVRAVDADTPARFNADTRCLHESAGCAGKLAVFAVRLDTYPQNAREQVFYIGTNDPDDLTDLRRHMLTQFETLPVSAEYMHREVFDITATYGKDTMVMIDKLGTDKLPTFFALKGAVDARLNKTRWRHRRDAGPSDRRLCRQGG